ncbi:MAG: transglycosylase SLT domain-containing protein [Pseudobdellovibrionaceae bacterium]
MKFKFKSLIEILLEALLSRRSRKTNVNSDQKSNSPTDGGNLEKLHPWRSCRVGEHWVGGHQLWVPATDHRPGYFTHRDGHCKMNPTRRKSKVVEDYITADEMQFIADHFFAELNGPPSYGKLPEYKDNADRFDLYIRGWTRYWNEILKPNEALDPDLVKALIATESSFDLSPKPANAGSAGKALGLIQLTEQAIEALGDPQGELTNHFVKIKDSDTSDPNLSIGAGVRWLFRKRELASHRLKRPATWIEAIAEYKAYLKDIQSGKDPHPAQMKKLDLIYKRLKE